MVPFIKIGAVAIRAHNPEHVYAHKLLKAGSAPALGPSRARLARPITLIT
jgi:hypothetical protein